MWEGLAHCRANLGKWSWMISGFLFFVFPQFFSGNIEGVASFSQLSSLQMETVAVVCLYFKECENGLVEEGRLEWSAIV